MSKLVLKIENLVELDLLHFANFSCDFEVCSFVLTAGRVGKNFVKLHHRVFKGLNLHILGLRHHEELVKFLHEVVNLSVQVCKAGVLSV